MRRSALLLTLSSCVLGSGCAAAPRLIDEDREGGFAIYRSGQLDSRELSALCDLGVEEIVVMDGGADRLECRRREEVCPDLRVRYNHRQDARHPVSLEFLAAFQEWVEESRRSGRRVAFRCRHGWHRTGRLAAFYRIHFQNWTAAEAIDEMLRLGRFMNRHRELQPQVEAMADLLSSGRCEQAPEHCPSLGSPMEEGLLGTGNSWRFACDVCSTERLSDLPE